HHTYPGKVLAHQVWHIEGPGPRTVVAGFGNRTLRRLGRSLMVGLSEGWSPLWNGGHRSDHAPVPGMWAIEPHLGFHGVGGKLDLSDPRWEVPAIDSPGGHPWYKAQSQEVRSGIGLYRFANAAKVGVQFENLLNRGLYTYAFKLPNGSAEFRYAYHEAIEEGHHGMMFQELVNRTGFDIPGLPAILRLTAQFVPMLGRFFPELFFFFVLGGEDPI